MSTKGTRRKISVKSVKLSDQPEGFTFAGKFIGTVQGQPFTTIDVKGEITEKVLTSVILENEKQERIAYLADKGLVGGITEAMVKEGDTIEIVKLKKVNIGKGRTMNQYDIFAV